MTIPAKSLAIETIVRSSGEGTCSYQKFAVLDGIIIGEVIPCAHNNMRFKESFNQNSPPPSTPGKAELIEEMSQRVKENINQQIRDYLRQEHNNFGVVNIDNDSIAHAIFKTIQPYLRGE